MKLLQAGPDGILPIIHYPKGSVIAFIRPDGRLFLLLETHTKSYSFRHYSRHMEPLGTHFESSTIQEACASLIRDELNGNLYQFPDEQSMRQYLNR